MFNIVITIRHENRKPKGQPPYHYPCENLSHPPFRPASVSRNDRPRWAVRIYAVRVRLGAAVGMGMMKNPVLILSQHFAFRESQPAQGDGIDEGAAARLVHPVDALCQAGQQFQPKGLLPRCTPAGTSADFFGALPPCDNLSQPLCRPASVNCFALPGWAVRFDAPR